MPEQEPKPSSPDRGSLTPPSSSSERAERQAIPPEVLELAEGLNLEEQYKSQFIILNEAGILEILPETQDKGIIGIDGREYPIPTYQEILESITPETLKLIERKVEQGFTKLRLVPLGMPLEVLAERYKRVLLEHHSNGTLLSTDGAKLELNRDDPLYLWEGYKGADAEGKLVYFPKQFDPGNHQGKTKQELIDEREAWQVLLIEDLPDLPAEGQGKTLGSRKQLEANQSPKEYLNLTQSEAAYQGEQGLTPEGWLVCAITELAETNRQIDDWQGQGKYCYNFGAYFPSVSLVPNAYFYRDDCRAHLGRYYPGSARQDRSARSAVKIYKP